MENNAELFRVFYHLYHVLFLFHATERQYFCNWKQQHLFFGNRHKYQFFNKKQELKKRK